MELEKLRVWQDSMDLCYFVNERVENFRNYDIRTQIRRCSISVPSNIAEGYGRNSTKEFARFLRISLGSIYELKTQILLSQRFGYLSDADTERILSDSKRISVMIVRLIKSLENKSNQ